MHKSSDTGGLSTHERISRIEYEVDAQRALGDNRSREMWKKITELEIKIGQNTTRLVIALVVFEIAVQFAMQRFL